MSAMEKPKYGKQRSASGAFSVARHLTKPEVPKSAVPTPTRPKPQVGKPNPGGRVKTGRNE